MITELLNVVALLFVTSLPSTEISGTGFFVAHNKRFFLISNLHVLDPNLKGKSLLKVMCPKKNGKKVEVFNNENVVHKIDKKIDLAAVEITVDLIKECGFKTLGPEHIYIEKDSNALVEFGNDVLTVGFPRGFFDENSKLPIGKVGMIASSFDPKNQTFFWVDSSLFNGNSGSPVFLKPSISYKGKNGGMVIGDEQMIVIGVNYAKISSRINGFSVNGQATIINEDLELNSVIHSKYVIQLLSSIE